MAGRRPLARLTYIANVRLPTERAHGLQIVRMSEAFQCLGIHTTLGHPARRQPAFLEGVDPLAFYGVRCPFDIRVVANIDMFRVEAWLPDRLWTIAHFVHSWAWARYAVGRLAASAPADLFVTRDIPIASVLVARRLPTLLEMHGAPERWSLGALRRVAASPFLCAVVTVTEALRETLAARGVVPAHSVVLHDGVSLERYDEAPAAPRSGDRPTVLYTGHLFREKGVATLVEAARRLGPDVAVTIAGGRGVELTEWRRRIARDGPRNVEFAGYLAPDRIPSLQKSADVLVLPNSGGHPHSARYSSPMKLFEYMAAGRPIVSSDVPAIREVLVHDVNGWLVPPDDPEQLAAAVRRLLGDRALGRRLADRARLDVRRHTWAGRAIAMAEAAGYCVASRAMPEEPTC